MNSKLRNFQKKVWYLISPVLYNISPVLASKVLFLFSMKQRLNLKNPRTFNEKLQWLKLYWQDDRVALCADKYDVRQYVKECGLDEILNTVYGVYTSVDDIDFETLPEKFALKGTHGCGYNIICKNKSEIDKNQVIKTCKKWLKSRYSYISAEVQYDKMKPKLIVEKFIDGIDGKGAIDYKIFCFNGNPMFTMVCEDRSESERAKYYFYDNNWDVLPYNNDSKSLINSRLQEGSIKPASFSQMLEYAKKLSGPFPFVRVDFYDVNGKTILGEMTFTPCAGIDSRLDRNIDILMGDLINLPSKKIV